MRSIFKRGRFLRPGLCSARWCFCYPSTECVTPAHCHADGAGHACHLSPGSAAGLGPRAPSLNPGCRAEAGNSPRCPRKPESLSRAFNAHSVSTYACLTQVPAPLTGPGPAPPQTRPPGRHHSSPWRTPAPESCLGHVMAVGFPDLRLAGISRWSCGGLRGDSHRLRSKRPEMRRKQKPGEARKVRGASCLWLPEARSDHAGNFPPAHRPGPTGRQGGFLSGGHVDFGGEGTC